MSDTAERVKKCPRPWEQRLLSAARVDGQEAVDRMAERIARHNDRCRALYGAYADGEPDYRQFRFIVDECDASAMLLYTVEYAGERVVCDGRVAWLEPAAEGDA